MRTNAIVTLVLFVLLCVAPIALRPDSINLLSNALVSALFALSFGMLAGQAGILSFGHAAYFGLGAFTTVHVFAAVENSMAYFPTPFIPLAGGIAGLLSGLIAGWFVARRSGIYASMITLAIAELIFSLSPTMDGFFGGEGGVSGSRMPWLGISFGADIHVYYMVLAWCVVCGFAMWASTFTIFGRLTVASREAGERLRFLGYDLRLTRLAAFALSGFFAGIAGGLYATILERANYNVFSLEVSANVVLHSFIGGLGSFFGPAIGAAILAILRGEIGGQTKYWLLYQGLLFIAMMLFAPGGLTQIATELRQGFRTGSWGSFALTVLRTTLGAALVGAAIILMSELLGARGFTDGARSAEATKVFGLAWNRLAPLTWVIIVIIAAIGIMLLRIRTLVSGFHRIRSTIPARHLL